MKFVVERQQLHQKLAFLKYAIPKKEIEPVLNNFLFSPVEGDPTTLQVVSTDLDLMSVTFIKVQSLENPEPITIPAAKLLSLVSKLKGDVISFELDGTDINIACGSYSGTFKTVGTDKYPDIRKITEEKISSLDRAKAIQGFKRIKFAVGTDEAKKQLMAVHIKADAMIASNGRVTAIYREDFGLNDLIISSTCLGDLISVLEASKAETMDIYMDSAYIIFKLGEDIFFTRQTTIQFPDVSNRIDKPSIASNKIGLTFKIGALRDSISRIMLTANEDSRSVHFEMLDSSHFEISAFDGKGFKSKEILEFKLSILEPEAGQEKLAQPTELSFNVNADIVLEVLSKLSAEDVLVTLCDNIRIPLRIDEAKFSCFLMRLANEK